MRTPPRLKKLLLTGLVGGLVGFSAPQLQAAGFGKLSVLSSLGQPLQAEIELVAVAPEEVASLVAQVASVDAFRAANIEYNPAFNSIRFAVERRGSSQTYLRVSSSQPINEPFLDLLIELTWPSGHLTREFSVLLDPPGFAATQPPLVESPPAAAATVEQPAARHPAPTGEAPGEAAITTGTTGGTNSYGPIKSGETLSTIALKVKPEGINLDQMLVAMFRQNPDAFLRGNLNLIKSGAILKLPTAAQAQALAAGEAQREVKAHTADWASYRNRLAVGAASAPARANGARQAVTGKIGTAKVEHATPPSAEGREVLKLSKGGAPVPGASAAKGAAQQERINALQEDLISRGNALKESHARIAELEKNVQDMQKLLEMKAASAVSAASGQKPASKTADKPAAPQGEPKDTKAKADGGAPTEKNTPQEASSETSARTLIAKQSDAQQPPPEVAKLPDKPAQAAPAAKPQSAPAPVPAAESTLVDDLISNPIYWGAGAAVLGLLGLLGSRALRKRREDALRQTTITSALATDLRSGTVTEGKGGAVVDTGNSSFLLTDFDKASPAAVDTDEVDPVAEAEVYIAYGRDAQAEEILKEARAKDPGRYEIALKLLEIYAARGNQEAFASLAAELQADPGEAHPIWAQVVEMGRKLDPGSALLSGAGAGQPAVAAAGAAAVGMAATLASGAENTVEAPQPLADADATLNIDVPLDFNLDASPANAGGLSAGLAEIPSGALEFSADVKDLDQGDLTQPVAPWAKLDLSADTGGAALMDTPAVAPETSALANLGPFDLDLSEFDEPSAAATLVQKPVEAEPHQAASGAGGLGLSVADGLDSPAALAMPAMPPLDLSGISLEMSESEAVAAPAEMSEAKETPWHNVATKLDLARAYLEIGDKEGAKEILEEVIHEGDSNQQAEARVLTESLV